MHPRGCLEAPRGIKRKHKWPREGAGGGQEGPKGSKNEARGAGKGGRGRAKRMPGEAQRDQKGAQVAPGGCREGAGMVPGGCYPLRRMAAEVFLGIRPHHWPWKRWPRKHPRGCLEASRGCLEAPPGVFKCIPGGA